MVGKILYSCLLLAQQHLPAPLRLQILQGGALPVLLLQAVVIAALLASQTQVGLQPDSLRLVGRDPDTTIARKLEPLALRVRSMRAELPSTIARHTDQDRLALLASRYEDQPGVFVVGLDRSTESDSLDIGPGELIVAVNGKPVR